MKKIFIGFLTIISLFVSSIFFVETTFAEENEKATINNVNKEWLQRFQLGGSNGSNLPKEIIEIPVENGAKSAFVSFLTFIQKILLVVVLPLVAVGAGLYIAYELFTADGDEAKLKQAWMAVVYSIVAIIAIALSAFIVSLISRLNIG